MVSSAKYDGLKHKAIVHLPPLPDSGEKPKLPALVINIHALASFDKAQQIYTNLEENADEEKFVEVYPNGYSPARDTPLPGIGFIFNAGGCCADACHEPIDDIGFFRKLVGHIKTEMPKDHNFEIDTQRIYATGMSNGGFVTHRVACDRVRVACEMSDIVAAVAVVLLLVH